MESRMSFTYERIDELQYRQDVESFSTVGCFHNTLICERIGKMSTFDHKLEGVVSNDGNSQK